MLIWIVLAVMAAFAVIIVIRPLVSVRAPARGRDEHERVVYRDQLAELERDRARNLIGDSEVASARAEIARRLIAAGEGAQEGPPPMSPRRRNMAAAAVILAIPAIALGGYLTMGSPGLPLQPFAAREAAPVQDQDLAMLVEKVERHLQDNPADASGWDVVAPAYIRLGRYGDAADAYGRAARLDGDTAKRLIGEAEARMFLEGGMIDARARVLFERASALEPGQPAPRYYLGLAAAQDGDVALATERWSALVADSPADAPWAREVASQLAALRATREGAAAAGQDAPTVPGPSAEDVAAAADMSAEDRAAMISGMVEGLAARLADSPDDLPGWLRLMNAYKVMGREDDARAALQSARAAFAGRDDALGELDAAARRLGLES